MGRKSKKSEISDMLGPRFRLIRTFKSNMGPVIFHDGLAAFWMGFDKGGYIDKSGEFKIKPQYEICQDFHDGFAFVKDKYRWFLINTDGDRVIDVYYDKCGSISEGIVRFQKHGMFGYHSVDGKVFVMPPFARAEDFHSGLAAVEIGEKTGFIDRTGSFVIPPVYDPIPDFERINTRREHWDYLQADLPLNEYAFHEGLAAVAKDGLYGYINIENEWVILPQFEKASFFKDGIATVRTRDGMTAINPSGEQLFPPLRICLGLFNGGLAGFAGTKYVEYNGVIRADGSLFHVDDSPGWDDSGRKAMYQQLDCSLGMIPFQIGGEWGPLYDSCQWGLLNDKGCVITPPEYDDIFAFGEHGLFSVRKGNKNGLITKKGEVLVACNLDEQIFYDGDDRMVIVSGNSSLLYEIMESDKITTDMQDETDFSDRSRIEKAVVGVMKIKALYSIDEEYLHPWKTTASEGLCVYCQKSLHGFYDEEGQSVISPSFARVSDFHGGVCCVSFTIVGPEWSYIDRSGQKLFDLKSPYFIDAHDGRIMVRKQGKTGYLDIHGNTAVPYVYDLGNDFSEGLASVETGGRWGFINQEGEMVIPPAFDSVSYTRGSLLRFSEGLSAVLIGGKYGYINRLGAVVIEPRFVHAGDFRDGCAEVQTRDGYSIIDHSGNYIVPMQPRRVRRVHEFLFVVGNYSERVKAANYLSLMDRDGSVIVPPCPYVNVENYNGDYSAGVIPVRGTKGVGLMNFKGEVVSRVEHDSICCESYGYNEKTGEYLILFTDNGKCGVMNQHGEVLVEPIFYGECWFDGVGLLNIIDEETQKLIRLRPCC